MTELELMRLYLRDQALDSPRFTDEDLNTLYLGEGSIEGAVALGWLLIASSTMGGAVSESIGNTSESYGQPTEQYKVAMAMHHYWAAKIPNNYRGGRWWEMVPGGRGIIPELLEQEDWLINNLWFSSDTSRLLPYF